MTKIKLGVCLASMNLRIRRCLEEAAKLSVAGVQVDSTGDLDPRRLTDTGRREFGNLLRSFNLQLTAVNCPLRHGLDVKDNLDQRLDHIKKVMDLAAALGPRVILLEPGKLPEAGTDQHATMTSALWDLARHGDRQGVIVALECGLDTGERVNAFLSEFDTGSLAVNFDPADHLLHGHDPVKTVNELGSRIVHAHAHDGRKAGTSLAAFEVPVGAGDIEWMSLLAALDGVEYRGWLVVERRAGESRLRDIESGVKFLRRFVG